MNISRRAFLQASIGVFILGCAGMGRAEENTSRRPNVVFLLADQWRASATGYAGDPNVKTPNLDKLAKESINFETAVSVCPLCTQLKAGLKKIGDDFHPSQYYLDKWGYKQECSSLSFGEQK